MANDNVKKLPVIDTTGVMKNINDILELFRNNDLKDIAVMWRRKSDETTRSFWNGDNLAVMGMASQLILDVGMTNGAEYYGTYPKALDDDDGDDEC